MDISKQNHRRAIANVEFLQESCGKQYKMVTGWFIQWK